MECETMFVIEREEFFVDDIIQSPIYFAPLPLIIWQKSFFSGLKRGIRNRKDGCYGCFGCQYIPYSKYGRTYFYQCWVEVGRKKKRSKEKTNGKSKLECVLYITGMGHSFNILYLNASLAVAVYFLMQCKAKQRVLDFYSCSSKHLCVQYGVSVFNLFSMLDFAGQDSKSGWGY